jgi:trigger factor
LVCSEDEKIRGERMKKKTLAVTLSVLMVALLAGCSKELSNEYVTIKQYEGLEVTQAETPKVSDEQVESTVNGNLSAAATSEEITDRAAQEGDIVNIDYKGTVDGVEFEGGSATGASLQLGSQSYIGANGEHKGFEEQVAGHNIGENFDITVQFPADYQNTDMADKVAVFNITLNGISVSKVPELTDEWVKANSEKSKTIEEYKAEIKKQLEESNKESADATLQTGVMEALLAQVEVKKYPDGEVDKQLQTIKEYYEGMAQAYGMEFADFAEQYMGLSADDFNTQAKEAAEQSVARKLACELIAKKKKLEPSEKEYEEQIKEYAESSGYDDVDAFKEQAGEDVLKTTILQQKVAEYLVDKCVQVEQTGENTTDSSAKE